VPGSPPAPRAELHRRAVALRALHVPGDPLIVVNAWDAASARTIAAVPGCKAIATASWSIGAALGPGDHEALAREDMLAAVGRIATPVDLPVTADLERGYGDAGETASLAISLGVVGANLEDSAGDEHSALRSIDDAAGRVAAMRAAASAAKVGFVINARTDTADVDEALERGRAYVNAGADCVFAVAATDEADIARLVDEMGAPVSVLARPNGPSLARLTELGVARISFGPGPMGVAMAALRDVAATLLAGGPLPAELGFRPPAGS
jgi:2-methylisocitrate lyase-like PEP mutase family enzyme